LRLNIHRHYQPPLHHTREEAVFVEEWLGLLLDLISFNVGRCRVPNGEMVPKPGVHLEDVLMFREQYQQQERAETTQNSLGRYLRDMAQHKCLSAEGEVRLSRELITHETTLWTRILSYAPTTSYVVRALENMIGQQVIPELIPLRQAADDAKRVRNKTAGQTLKTRAAAAAQRLQELDLNRSYLSAILDILKHEPQTDYPTTVREIGRPPFYRHTSGYRTYLERIQETERAATAVRNKFVESNLKLVVSLARHYLGLGLSFADLIQEGNLGLMKAVDRYDYRLGYRFSTYASWWIRHYISRGIKQKVPTVRVPIHVFERNTRVARAQRNLTNVLGREPTDEELSEASGISLDKLEVLESLWPRYTISLDTPLHEDDERLPLENFKSSQSEEEKNIVDELATQQSADRILQLMYELPPRDRDVLQKRFALQHDHCWTLQEIADGYHLSRERIRQIEEKALDTLRKKLAAEGHRAA
jgi:RNA polymerase primary sigma factor